MYDRRPQPTDFSQPAVVIDMLNEHLENRNRRLKRMRRQLVAAGVYMVILLACLVATVLMLMDPDWAAVDWMMPFRWLASGQKSLQVLGIGTLVMIGVCWVAAVRSEINDRSGPR